MNKKLLIVCSILLGVIFLIVSGIYFMTPAGSLPTYMPGFEAGSAHIHLKHAIGSLILALALFVFAWFKSGKKSTN